MPETTPIISLLTDFGLGSYVGAMKGVMLTICPDARLVDITHTVNPQDVLQASSILSTVYPYFPAHTVHLVVVDPGVGTRRRPLALATPHGRFVAPDNGVLTHVLLQESEWQAVALDNETYWRPGPSHTFHGRDIFGPAAAHLARGVALEQLGTPVTDLVRLELPRLDVTPHSISGHVASVDHFGNVLTDIGEPHWLDEATLEFRPLDPDPAGGPPLRFAADAVRISFGWHIIEGMHHTYSEVPVGQPLALVSSSRQLEIAVNQGSAQNELGAKIGDLVTLFFAR